jgi:hypothetical protein
MASHQVHPGFKRGDAVVYIGSRHRRQGQRKGTVIGRRDAHGARVKWVDKSIGSVLWIWIRRVAHKRKEKAAALRAP